jgi:hypothetical protein
MIQLIDGFQSALALEILATVDYVKKEKALTNEVDIIHAVQNWSNRKHNLFQEKHILIAIRHLERYSVNMSLA